MKRLPRVVRARQRVNALVAALRTIPRGRYATGLLVLSGNVVVRSFIGARVPGTWFLENVPVALTGV